MCGCLSHVPYWGLGQQPKHVPWLGIKLATFCFADGPWIHLATLARVNYNFFIYSTKEYEGSNIQCWWRELESSTFKLIGMSPALKYFWNSHLCHLLQLNTMYLPWLVWLSGLSAACKPKGHWFYSKSGHIPGFQPRSPVGSAARGKHTLMFLSLPSPLSKNK